MLEITAIIPAYGPSSLVERAVGSLALQWMGKNYINIIIVNDCSPNTDNDYQDLVDKYAGNVKSIKCIRTKENSGQGTARQTGIDACETEYFMLCDEDDMYSPIAVYNFCDALEKSIYEIDEKGEIVLDEFDKPKNASGYVPVAVVAAALEQTTPNMMTTITNGNNLWLNSKLYCKRFLTKHDIRFNPLSSRHSEDYQFMQDFFFCLDNDEKWTGVLIDDSKQLYYWLENENSQSRKDPFYGEMLSGYTCRSSVLGLNFIEDCEKHKIEKTEQTEAAYLNKLINNTAYNYFCLYNFFYKMVAEGYEPLLEDDWIILRDSVKILAEKARAHWDEFTYTQRMEQIYACKNLSDCHTDGFEPMVDLDTFILKGDDILNWSFKDIMREKDNYTINEKGLFIKKN